ncbi:class I SAM-dependent methyltransferase [Anaerofustis sp.]|uniref:class I SAM-dependent methyltransferase n=1 Tax=Anaerofustis sp. TaxID=1872517 RepID=UPI0025B987ED|nr:class I SAM-dependent methyltransferase [Anaerofustis sp.]
MNNNSYKEFSRYYDLYTSFVDYEIWRDYLLSLSNKDCTGRNILDLGCGNGNLLLYFSDITKANLYGVDLSEEMLSLADQNAFYENKQINLIKADMTNFMTDIKFDLIYSACDSINYIMNEDELRIMFNNIINMMNENCIFTFDIISPNYKSKDETLKYENISFEIKRKKTTNLLYTDIEIFENNRQITKISHKQKIYTTENIKIIAKNAGFKNIDFYDFLTKKQPDKKSDKIQVVLST